MAVLFAESLGAIRAALSVQTWILLITFLLLLAWYSVSPYRFFKQLGVPGPRPLPFIGTFLHYRKGMFGFDTECYKKYGKLWGIYDGRQPILSIMDPDLIKTIFIKEFYTLFTNRRDFGLNGPLAESILIVQDDHWKRIRSVLSPTFTSGRLKEMCPIISHYAENLVKHAKKKAKLNESADMKDIFGTYSMDVVTSTAFSVDVDSINNPNDLFISNIKKLIKFSFFNPVLILALVFPAVVPILAKLNFSFFPRDVNAFFMNVLANLKAKRQKGVHTDRVDFLQLMVDSQVTNVSSEKQNGDSKSIDKGLTDTEILAQAMTFIFAGYETTSNTLSYTAHNLAIHPDVQKKLQQEIDEAFPNKAPPTYEGVMQLEYMEMVISETLRMFPPAPRIDRVCKKDVQLNGVTVPKGTVVMVPAYVLHHDPKYWPEPEEFRPERFSKENRESRNPNIFLPFGVGPRNCIGMRFAQLMMKMALASFLQHLTIVPCQETSIPLELDVKGPMHPKKPVILKFVPRVNADSRE
ncbi:cytochrome P450 3A21-like isoform X1 [Hemiscyllium ocellatum]|uniref:cytochrome P450 3A21-like isoform X1 n=1 Tax=Hemiscyllium ocellatum TaxID=170820 RepID=UPI0029664787|nr:cytochrome P450 3A21-like isoform X1 [Hemiscyllium ocellatum]